MSNEIAKELQISNLLTALSMSENTPENNEICKKVLKYVITQEMNALQYDIALLPRKDKVSKDYNFHLN